MMKFSWTVLGKDYRRDRFENGKEVSFLEIDQRRASQLVLQTDSTFVLLKRPEENFVLFERVYLSQRGGQLRVLVAGIEGRCYLFFLPNATFVLEEKESPLIDEISLRLVSCQK